MTKMLNKLIINYLILLYQYILILSNILNSIIGSYYYLSPRLDLFLTIKFVILKALDLLLVLFHI